MNANEIVMAFRDKYDETDKVYFFARTLFREAADLIESLQYQLIRVTEVKNALESDLINTNGNLEHVTALLAESQRREKAAVRDMADGLVCGACIHAACRVDEPPCDGCNSGSSAFEWRPLEEERNE